MLWSNIAAGSWAPYHLWQAVIYLLAMHGLSDNLRGEVSASCLGCAYFAFAMARGVGIAR